MSRKREESGRYTEIVPPDDPFWDLELGASGERDVSEGVDEILYDGQYLP